MNSLLVIALIENPSTAASFVTSSSRVSFLMKNVIFCCTVVFLLLYTLSGRIGKVVVSQAAVARSIPLRCTDLYYARGAQGALPKRVGGATSQLDLPSLTPLSVAGCG